MLSILCVTKCEPHALSFLRQLIHTADEVTAQPVIVYDGRDAEGNARQAGLWHPSHWRVQSKGYIESVLDEALTFCSQPYVLRVDDDELITPAMRDWLAAEAYMQHNHWKFARPHLIDDRRFISTPQLWPDHQTRLSLREYAGGRSSIHAGSPFGGGHLAPVMLAHAKFLVKSREDREAIADRYDAIHPGAGRKGGMTAFQLPEDVYTDVPVYELGDGTLKEFHRMQPDGWVNLRSAVHA